MSRMDKTEVNRSNRNTTKTDLCLLLECVKFQMKNPDLQKQALLTIHSICENREDNVDLLREMGGVVFLFNLSKSSVVHSEVKETALFTLGTLAEANVYCKNSLCRKETFASLADWILKEDIPLTLKRVSVYLLFVLVANNKLGQTLALTTGCLDILLDLFRSSFPLSAGANPTAPNGTQTYQLWTSVSSALCGCVNNPQNEEGQRVCVGVFPILKLWLQRIELPCTEIFQTICSFISMTVSNNPYAQESFSVSGGLKTLTLTLVGVASAAHSSQLSYQLSIILSKTLSACITDKPALASGLAQYNVVSHLISLLESPHVDPEDRLSVLISLGRFTEASEEHQFQLVQCGALPLVITLLTEDTDEEIKKATTFILQGCKQATLCFGESRVQQTTLEEPLTNLDDFRRSARALLRKIDRLEEQQKEGVSNEEEDINQPTLSPRQRRPSLSPQQRRPSLSPQPQFKTPFLKYNKYNNHTRANVQPGAVSESSISEPKPNQFSSDYQPQTIQTSGGSVLCAACKGTGALRSSHTPPIGGDRELTTTGGESFNSLFLRENTNLNKSTLTKEMEKIPAERNSLSQSRCSGCVLTFEDVTSRTFTSVQSSSHHSCDMHRIVGEATDRFRTRRLLLATETHADISGRRESQRRENYSSLTLTPRRAATPDATSPSVHGRTGPRLTPLKRQKPQKEPAGDSQSAQRRKPGTSGVTDIDQLKRTIDSSTRRMSRRRRKEFSRAEEQYLLSGVKSYGFSWNNILWSFPFQFDRTNADLARKYRQMMSQHKTLLN